MTFFSIFCNKFANTSTFISLYNPVVFNFAMYRFFIMFRRQDVLYHSVNSVYIFFSYKINENAAWSSSKSPFKRSTRAKLRFSILISLGIRMKMTKATSRFLKITLYFLFVVYWFHVRSSSPWISYESRSLDNSLYCESGHITYLSCELRTMYIKRR